MIGWLGLLRLLNLRRACRPFVRPRPSVHPRSYARRPPPPVLPFRVLHACLVVSLRPCPPDARLNAHSPARAHPPARSQPPDFGSTSMPLSSAAAGVANLPSSIQMKSEVPCQKTMASGRLVGAAARARTATALAPVFGGWGWPLVLTSTVVIGEERAVQRRSRGHL